MQQLDIYISIQRTLHQMVLSAIFAASMLPHSNQQQTLPKTDKPGIQIVNRCNPEVCVHSLSPPPPLSCSLQHGWVHVLCMHPPAL